MKNLLTLTLKDDYYLEDTNILTQLGYALEHGTVFEQNHENQTHSQGIGYIGQEINSLEQFPQFLNRT